MIAVDLFAGWGGFSLGAERAGVDVAWAANHWPLAVEAHALNHPATQHICQDLRQADWSALPKYDILLASPACQGHSTASQPKRRRYHDALRATAWAVLDCADATEPAAVVVENVPSFRRWRLYGLWRDGLERLGYSVREHELMASQLGTPQRRNRLFVVATRKGASVPNLRFDTVPEPAFGPCVQWSAGRWRDRREASPGAQDRMTASQRRCGERFLTQHVTGHRGVTLEQPIRTITTKDQWCVVDGSRYRPLTLRELARGMGFPDHYGWPNGVSRTNVIRGLGNAVPPPVACSVVGRVAGAL